MEKREYSQSSNKFGASKVVFKGIKFDSTYERDRYIYLCHLQKKGLISGLRLQQKFVLIKKTIKLVPTQLKTKVRWDKRVVEQEADYHCDFVYIENGVYVCEEFKSTYTASLADYILRRKLMIKKIYAHNAKNHGKWVFREVIYHSKNKITIEDK